MDNSVCYLLWDGSKVNVRNYRTIRHAVFADPRKEAKDTLQDVLSTPNPYIVGVVLTEHYADSQRTVCAYFRPFAAAPRATFTPLDEGKLDIEPSAYWETHFVNAEDSAT